MITALPASELLIATIGFANNTTSTAAIGNSSTTRVPQHLLLPYLVLLHLLLVQEPEPQLFLLPAQLHYCYYYIVLHLLPNPTTTTTIAKIIALLPALHLIVAPQIWFPLQLSLLYQWEVLSPPFLLSCGFAGREKEPAAAVAAWIQAPQNPHTACCLGWEEWEERSVVAEQRYYSVYYECARRCNNNTQER